MDWDTGPQSDPAELSRNYSFADKRNGPWAVPKSSGKFLFRNFLPLEVKKRDTCSRFLAFAQQMLFHALLRETLRNTS